MSSKQATENEKYNELGNKKSFDRFYIEKLGRFARQETREVV